MYENLANILSLIFRLVGVLNEKKKNPYKFGPITYFQEVNRKFHI